MAEQFPNIKPSSRSLRPGQFPVKSYRAASGATVKRAFGNRAFGYQLEVQFENILDSVATEIINHYNTTKAGFERFALPPALFAGMSAALTATIQAPTQIKWEYSEAPQIESVISGRSSVSVSFIGELDY